MRRKGSRKYPKKRVRSAKERTPFKIFFYQPRIFMRWLSAAFCGSLETLEVALVGVVPPNVSSALVAVDALLACVLLVQDFNATCYAIGVGAVSI